MQFAMPNGRCRYHGGKSTGAKNPHINLIHGRYTKENLAANREAAALMKESRKIIASIEELTEEETVELAEVAEAL
jgi:hypothetical protein